MEEADILRKCHVDVKVWAANTSKKHPLGNLTHGTDQDFITYAFAGSIKSCGYGLLHYNENDRVAGVITSYQLQQRELWLPKTLEIEQSFLVPIHPEVNPADCVASLLPSLKAYTAFRQITRLGAHENVLIWCHDDLNTLCIVLQLCQMWNYRPIAIVVDDNAERALRSISNYKGKILRLNSNNIEKTIWAINDSTGGMGVSVVLDLSFEENLSHTINLSDLISCLSIFGHFVTDRHSTQLSQTDSNLLHLKSASFHYLFPETWILSPLHLGKFQQILRNVMDRLKDKTIRPKIDKTVELNESSKQNYFSFNKTNIVFKNVT